MKLLEWIKIFGFKHIEPKHEKKHELELNQDRIEGVKVITHSTSSRTYGLLRKFKTPRNEMIYLVRRAKGFNTLFFQQHYDIIVCDKNFKILDLFIDTKTGYISSYYPVGHFIYFAPVGTIRYNNFGINDRLRIRHTFM